MATLDFAKKAAACKAIDECVKDKNIIGIGNGATVTYAVERLAKRVKEENLNIICIPSSYPARKLALEHHLIVGELETHPKLDLMIDGADEVDPELNFINGGGGYFSQGKILASCSNELIIVADHTKSSQKLGGPNKKSIAIEIIPSAAVAIIKKIEENFGGQVSLKMGKAKYGPVVTDNGNFVLDWDFPNDISDWNKMNTGITLIPGVIETGIFLNMAQKVYFGMADGSVKVQAQS